MPVLTGAATVGLGTGLGDALGGEEARGTEVALGAGIGVEDADAGTGDGDEIEG